MRLDASADGPWSGCSAHWLASQDMGAQFGAAVDLLVPPGGGYDPYQHEQHERVVYVWEGGGTHIGSGGSRPLAADDVLVVPAGSWHGFRNDTDKPARLWIAWQPSTRFPWDDYAVADPDATGDFGGQLIARTLRQQPEDPDTTPREKGFDDVGIIWDGAAGATAITLGWAHFDPEGVHHMHRHANADEAMCITVGVGRHITHDRQRDMIGSEYLPEFAAAGEWHQFITYGSHTEGIFFYIGASTLEESGYELGDDEAVVSAQGFMTTVGIIGLGNMGSAIGERLMVGGYDVVGFDIAQSAEHEQRGFRLASDAADVARRAELILLSLPSADALAAVVDGPGGLSGSIDARHVIAETSTLSVAAKTVAHAICDARGAAFLDCALSGTPTSVRDGALAAFASGDETSFGRIADVFGAFTRTTTYVGRFGAATGLKLICNLLVMIHDAATAEAMALGIAAGFDRQVVYDVVCSSIASSRVFEQRGAMMVTGDYRPGSRSYVLAVKDGALIDELSTTHGAFTPMFQLARQMHLAGLGLGHADLDAASLLEVYRALGV